MDESNSYQNSLKTLLARFNKINENGEINKELNNVQKAFESVGVTFLDLENQIRPVDELLYDLNFKWDGLDKNTQMYLATQAAGVRQQNRFLAIMNSYNRVLEIQDDLIGAAGTTTLQYSRYLNSVEAASNRTKVAMEQMWIKAINTDLIKYFYNLTTILITIIDKIGLFRIAIFALIVALSAVKKGVSAFVANLYYIPAAMIQSIAMGRTLKETLHALSVAFNLAKIKAIALQAALTFGLSIAISFIIEGILKLTGAMENARHTNAELLASYQETISQNNAHIRSLQAIAGEYENLSRKTSLTVDEQKRLTEIQNEIASLSPLVVQSWDEQGNAIINLKGNVRDLIEELKESNRHEAYKLVAGGENAFKVMSKDIEQSERELELLNNQIKHLQGLTPIQELIHITSSADLFWEKNNAGLKQYQEALARGAITEREYLDVKRRLENEIENVSARISELWGNIASSTDAFRPYMRAILDSSNAFEILNNEQQKFLYDFVDDAKHFGSTWDEASSNMRELIRVVQTADFQGFVDNLDDIKTQLEDGIIDAEKYEEEFNKIIVVMAEMFNLDPEFLADIFRKAIPEVEEFAESLEEVAKRIDDTFNAASTAFDLLEKAMDELEKYGKLSAKTMFEIADKHAELIIPMLQGEASLRAALTNEMVNQEQAALDAFREKVSIQLETNKQFFNEMIRGNTELWNKVAIAYGKDFENFRDVAGMKARVNDVLVRYVGESWARLYGTEAEAISAIIDGMIRAGIPFSDPRLQQMIALKEVLEGTTSQLHLFIDGINLSNISLGKMESAAKSTSKALKDPYEEWLKVAERTANEVVKLIQDAYRKQKKAAIAAKDEEIRIAKEAHDAKMYMLDEEYKAFERKIDQQLRALDDEASEEDFQRELTKLIEERGEIESEIAKLALDDSYEARAKIEELEKEKARVIENIEALTRNRSRTLRRQEIQDIRDDFRDEIQAAKDKETEIFNATSERLAEEKREIGYFYDELINDDRYYAQVREDIISGNLDNINAKLREFITDFKEINQEAAYDMGLSFQELLNIIDRANAAIREMHGLGAPPASTAQSATTSTSGSSGTSGAKTSTPKQTTTPVTTPVPAKTTTRPNGTQVDYDKGYAKGYADGYHHLRKQTDFKNESIKYESGYNDGYTKGGYDGRSYTMMHSGGTVEEAHKGKVMGGGRSKLARDMFSLFDEPLKPDEVLAKLKINEVVVEPSIGYPILSKNIANLLKSVASSSTGGNNIVNNINFRVARMDGTEKDARKFVHILAKGIHQEQQGMGQR